MGEDKDKEIVIRASSSEDVEEVRELLKVVGDELPRLLDQLMGTFNKLMKYLYDPESARERARAIASFYKELVDSGIPEKTAMELTKEHFVNPMSFLKKIMEIKVKEDREE